MKNRTVTLTEAQIDDLRLEFDYLSDHGQTRAMSFYSWLRRRGYRLDPSDNTWYYIVK